MKDRFTGVIHFHSNFSFDSLTSIRSIVQAAKELKCNFLILTDHDTVAGSLKLKEYCESNRIPIEVPIAAEYKTNLGDIIAVFLKSEVISRDFNDFIDEVKDQGGLLFFPHPYRGHKEVERICEHVDFVEVFNPRLSDEENFKALKLAQKYNKKIYIGADAHFSKEMSNAVITFDVSHDNFRTSLCCMENLKLINVDSTNLSDIIKSQIIKAVKNGDIKLFYNNFKILIKTSLAFELRQKIGTLSTKTMTEIISNNKLDLKKET